MNDSPIIYDPATDSMYVTLNVGKVARTVIHDDRDYAVDVDENGQPMGYDIQFASKHPDVIAEALTLLQGSRRDAAE